MASLSEWIKRITEMGLEVASQRYYSKYQGVVTNNLDPGQQGRVLVKVSALGFTEPHGIWAYPTTGFAGRDHGLYFPPEIGEMVWVWFDYGDVTQPRYSGGWWLNPGPAKGPETSYVPSEFKSLVSKIPMVRGIKTKRGHGLMFGDDPTNPFVELWSGVQMTPGQSAVQNHRFRLDDKEQQITAKSKGGHYTVWSDFPAFVYVRTQTIGGHKVYLDDTLTRILIESAGGHTVLLDDNPATTRMLLRTVLGHKVELNDVDQTVKMRSAGGHQVGIDDLTGTIEARTTAKRALTLNDLLQTSVLSTIAGQLITQAPGITSVVDPGQVNVTAGGVLGLFGTGVTVASNGGGPSVQTATGTSVSDFTGDVTQNFSGAFMQVVNGTWKMLAGLAQVFSAVSGGVQLGFPSGTRYFLVTEAFLSQLYMTHTHTSAAVGAPTSTPNITGTPIPQVLVPGVHYTLGVRGN